MKKQIKNEKKNLPVGARDLSRAPVRRRSGDRGDEGHIEAQMTV